MSSRIAIIGGGITGLTAAYLLTEKYDIALFEESHRVGGNAYTYKARNGELFDIAVAALNKRPCRTSMKFFQDLRPGCAYVLCTLE